MLYDSVLVLVSLMVVPRLQDLSSVLLAIAEDDESNKNVWVVVSIVEDVPATKPLQMVDVSVEIVNSVEVVITWEEVLVIKLDVDVAMDWFLAIEDVKKGIGVVVFMPILNDYIVLLPVLRVDDSVDDTVLVIISVTVAIVIVNMGRLVVDPLARVNLRIVVLFLVVVAIDDVEVTAQKIRQVREIRLEVQVV